MNRRTDFFVPIKFEIIIFVFKVWTGIFSGTRWFLCGFQSIVLNEKQCMTFKKFLNLTWCGQQVRLWSARQEAATCGLWSALLSPVNLNLIFPSVLPIQRPANWGNWIVRELLATCFCFICLDQDSERVTSQKILGKNLIFPIKCCGVFIVLSNGLVLGSQCINQ